MTMAGTRLTHKRQRLHAARGWIASRRPRHQRAHKNKRKRMSGLSAKRPGSSSGSERSVRYGRFIGRRRTTALRAGSATYLDEAYISLERHLGYFTRIYHLQRRGTEEPGKDTPNPTFVLIHGVGVSARYFVPLADELREYGDVLFMDLPGFSTLPKPAQSIGFAELAAIVHSILRLRGLAHPVILGHSMGTQIVVELAARAPQMADRIMLLGPPMDSSASSIPEMLVRFARSSLYEPPSLSTVAAEAYAACGPSWFARMAWRTVRYPMSQRIGSTHAVMVLGRGEHDHVSTRPWLRTLAHISGLVVSRCPVADREGERGEEDIAAAVDASHSIGKRSLSIVAFPHAAHSVIYAHAALVASHLVALASHVPPGVKRSGKPVTKAQVQAFCTTDAQCAAAREKAREEEGLYAKKASAGLKAALLESVDIARAIADAALEIVSNGISVLRWAATAIPDYAVFARQTRVALAAGRRDGHDGAAAPAARAVDAASRRAPSRPIVVLLHGMAENWRYMKPLQDYVEGLGYETVCPDVFDTMLDPLDDIALRLQDWVDARGLTNIVFVAHSKGGLAAKQFMMDNPSLRCSAITLGTPWNGSGLAGFSPSKKLIRDLTPSSPAIERLSGYHPVNRHIVSLNAVRDQQVPNGAWLAGARNETIAVRGHQRLLESPAAFEAVGRHLAELCAGDC